MSAVSPSTASSIPFQNEPICSFYPFCSLGFASSAFNPLSDQQSRAISAPRPDGVLEAAPLYIVPVCSAQDIAADAQADMFEAKSFTAALPNVSSSCSFSVRICAINRFQHLQIGFRQNSIFAYTHLLQLAADMERTGHGEIRSRRNAKKLRTEMAAGDSLFEDDESTAATVAPHSVDRYSGPLMVPVDSHFRDRASATVLQDAEGVWDAHVINGELHKQSDATPCM